MDDKNGVKGKIRKVLQAHPEGLSILEVAKLVCMHRHTVTKYIYQMIGSGEIYQRELGPAKLCYSKKKFLESVKEKEILDEIKKRLK